MKFEKIFSETIADILFQVCWDFDDRNCTKRASTDATSTANAQIFSDFSKGMIFNFNAQGTTLIRRTDLHTFMFATFGSTPIVIDDRNACFHFCFVFKTRIYYFTVSLPS
jgi:hypothetical protein